MICVTAMRFVRNRRLPRLGGSVDSSWVNHALPLLGGFDLLSRGSTEVDYADLDSVCSQGLSFPARNRLGSRLVGEGEYQPCVGVNLSDCEQLQGVGRDLVALTTLQLSNVGEDLRENAPVGIDAVWLDFLSTELKRNFAFQRDA